MPGTKKPGVWAFIPEDMIHKDASGFPEQLAEYINVPHLYGRTDSYRPFDTNHSGNGGIKPPPPPESRVFRRPTGLQGRHTKTTDPFQRPSRFYVDKRLQSWRPRRSTHFALSSTVPSKSPTRLLEEQLAAIKPSPPPNAPTAPLADRMDQMNKCFNDMGVGDSTINIIPAPFDSYVSDTECTHVNCPVDGSHPEGLYLHEGKLSDGPHEFFGAANPPPWLWKAYERLEKVVASEVDMDCLQHFLICHPPHVELASEGFWPRSRVSRD